MNSLSLPRHARLLTTACLIAGLSACSDEPPVVQPVKAVRTLVVGANAANSVTTETSTRAYPGEVKARFETQLGFRVPGKIVSRLVDSGATVKHGQALAKLDAADFALQVAQTNAQAQLATAELKRFQDLRSKNFVSQAALDSRIAAATSAQAQAKLTHNQAAYTTLTADRDGVIAAVFAEAGQVVAAGQPIIHLVPNGDREIAISLPEGDISRLHVGAAATITLWSRGENAPVMTGQLREIAAAADPLTRTYAARVALPASAGNLPVGLSATVRFAAAKDEASSHAIPLSAIFQNEQQMAVWKVGAGETVTLVPVSISRYAGDQAIVTHGISAGDRIVTAGVNLLAANQKVHAVTAVSATAAAENTAPPLTAKAPAQPAIPATATTHPAQ
ncbi:MAG TPA: efflux RND transporter periplasmic adaptor subunit [Rugosibacter sp.]|nr:efflux RND transporter periplasmic adaptor subunit [Rugosibacter sp.]HQN46155.1 efflux RND transporter periplasmic adaptor subunit [Rugosibacter sp.]